MSDTPENVTPEPIFIYCYQFSRFTRNKAYEYERDQFNLVYYRELEGAVQQMNEDRLRIVPPHITFRPVDVETYRKEFEDTNTIFMSDDHNGPGIPPKPAPNPEVAKGTKAHYHLIRVDRISLL